MTGGVKDDRDAARRELEDRYGVEASDTDDLLARVRSACPPELRQAQLRPVDEAATAKLDLERLAAKVRPEHRGNRVLSASVRGADVVYVSETEDGAIWKGVIPASEVGAEPAERVSGGQKRPAPESVSAPQREDAGAERSGKKA